MGEIPKVALLIETARGFGRDFLLGVARYSRLHGPWSIHITPGDYNHVVPEMKQWGGLGIIARIPNWQVANAIIKANVPTIALGLTDEQLRPGNPLATLSNISSDASEVARLAAEHLLERQLTRFAYVGSEERPWSQRRQTAFQEVLALRDHDVHVYRPPKIPRGRAWEQEQKFLAQWVSKLPTPIGLFACDDDRGREVLEACKIAGLNIPEDIAVVGVDNDEIFCELSDPPLSSVALNAEEAGYRAAALLNAMMRGKVCDPQRILVEASCVVTRRSTAMVAVSDLEVAAALQFIQREYGNGITVDDVVEEVAVSRSNLERRFRKSLGRTILQEIQLLRLERARRLLVETNFPMATVASMAGFGSSAYFNQFFLKRMGHTPSKYRRRLTGGARRFGTSGGSISNR